jgi:hypothetical protein
VCPVLIPTEHTSEASEDASLRIVHIACAAFRGRDGGNLLRLFRDTLSTIYENIITLDSVEAFQMPKDYFTTLNEAAEAAIDLIRVELDARTELYLFEFSKITKTGGLNNPYATVEWPGIQILQPIINNLNEKPLKFNLYTDKGAREKHYLFFYERNPTGRGLDFTQNSDAMEGYIQYAVDLHCLNLVADTRKTPLPPLEDLAEGVMAHIRAGLRPGT